MRILLAGISAATLVLTATIGAASADTHPSGGFASTGRNDAGFGEGPHCHVNVIASENNPKFDAISVFPSHAGHVASGTADGPFQADPNCDGDAGN